MITFGPKVTGQFTARIYDGASGKLRFCHTYQNLILGGFYDAVFTPGGAHMHTWGATNGIAGSGGLGVGTGTTAPTLSDTGLESMVYENTTTGTKTKSANNTNPVWEEETWTFPIGFYTGTINEVGVYGSSRYIARQVLSPSLTIGATDLLEITYRTNFFFDQVHTGTIAGGSRNGSSVDWRLTINNDQCMNHGMQSTSTSVSDTGRNPYDNFWDPSKSNRIALGTSNAESDLANDSHNTLKGTTIKTLLPTVGTISSYTDGDYSRDCEYFIEPDYDNSYSVGEILVASKQVPDGAGGYLFRVTFDPVLDLAAGYRLGLQFRIAFNP